MTHASDQQDDKYGEPSVVAETLHGDKARAEEHPQPDAVALDSATLVTRPGDDTETDAGRTSRR